MQLMSCTVQSCQRSAVVWNRLSKSHFFTICGSRSSLDSPLQRSISKACCRRDLSATLPDVTRSSSPHMRDTVELRRCIGSRGEVLGIGYMLATTKVSRASVQSSGLHTQRRHIETFGVILALEVYIDTLSWSHHPGLGVMRLASCITEHRLRLHIGRYRGSFDAHGKFSV